MAAVETQNPTKETFHFINKPEDAINEALTGLTHTHPNLSYNPTYKVLYRTDLPTFRQTHVTTIGFSGGGHEPMFSGFVGPNYLSAFVSGNIFASPTAAQIFAAIKMCQPLHSESHGTLIVCGNYTGDILNAGLAVTRAQAAGYKVSFSPIGDDVAIGRKKGGKVGRRGLAGHLIGLKIACALASSGSTLEHCTKVLEYVASNLGTVGVAFDRVALPNSCITELHQLPSQTIELGMGAHGEPGLRQLSPIPSPEDLISQILDLLVDIGDEDRGFIPFSASSFPLPSPSTPSSSPRDNEIVLLLNSLGSTSDELLAKFAETAIADMKQRGFVVKRLILGPLITSLKMSGFGVTVWRLPDVEGEIISREEALRLWDVRVDVAAWRQ